VRSEFGQAISAGELNAEIGRKSDFGVKPMAMRSPSSCADGRPLGV
jgi:hypothetical protein